MTLLGVLATRFWRALGRERQ
jgi:hypothetical protein